MMMSMTCYYDTNDELFIIIMMHDAKLLYEHDELLYISVSEMTLISPTIIYIITNHGHKII